MLEGLELLLSPEEEESPELDDAEESDSSLAGLLGGGEMRTACMWQVAVRHCTMQALSNDRPKGLKAHYQWRILLLFVAQQNRSW